MDSKKKILIKKIKKKKDEVRVSSTGSFPASDPPAYWASAPAEPSIKEEDGESDEKDSE